ncbi:ATP-grasp domain-containing protein [Nesterenkonia sp. K-15-9-6]|uniref:ATP-grasp domain-containing protein n=1 Tax=Nesterenkonia sp. K-15-9-6 TaxID=3093918 RepID=UPI004043E7F0
MTTAPHSDNGPQVQTDREGEAAEIPHPRHFSPEVMREAAGFKLSSYSIALEAWRRGLTVRALDGSLRRFRVSDGERTVRFDKSRPSLTAREAILIEQDKSRTNRCLSRAGVATPDSVTVDLTVETDEDVVARAEAKGYPVVAKPSRGSMGRGVFTGIGDADTLRLYLGVLREELRVDSMILERHIPGEDYRVLVVGDRAVAACYRVPANVIGDGTRTIDELIDQKNRLRAENPYLKPIIRDAEIEAHIRDAGHTRTSVLPEGDQLLLRGKANASAGGDTFDVTDQLPRRLGDLAVRAAQAVPGLALAGVDLRWTPVAGDDEGDVAVIELNSRPEIELNMYPWEGTGRDVPREIIDAVFPDSQPPGAADAQLHWPLRPVLDLIGDGVASEVEIAPVPAHRFAHRRRFRLTGGITVTSRQRSRLVYGVKKLGVAGSLTARTTADGETETEMIVCGPRWAVRSFTAHAGKALGVDWGSGEPWKGPVTPGFDLPSPTP